MTKDLQLEKITKLISEIKPLDFFGNRRKLYELMLKAEDYVYRFSTLEQNKNLLTRNFPEFAHPYDSYVDEDIVADWRLVKTRLVSTLEILKEHIEDDIETQNISIPTNNNETNSLTNKVFIVHGHDSTMEIVTKDFLKALGLEPIILHEQTNTGKTILEKFEENANEVGYAIVLFSPDDEVHKNGNMTYQPRPNVILELGYFMGKLGRDRVSLLLDKSKTASNIPSDILGYLYTEFDAPNGLWRLKLTQELKAAGYNVDANNLI